MTESMVFGRTEVLYLRFWEAEYFEKVVEVKLQHQWSTQGFL